MFECMQYFVIDRFEEDVAVCEDSISGKMVSIPRCCIEASAREGDVIYEEEGMYKISASETQKAKEDILSLLQKNQSIE